MDQISSEPIHCTLPCIFGRGRIVNRPGIVKESMMNAFVDVYFVRNGLPIQIYVKGPDIGQRYAMVFTGIEAQDRYP